MDLKCSTYGPEHKTARFRSIEDIVNLWELVGVEKICVILTKTAMSGKVVKKIFQNPSFYEFYFFLGVQKRKLLQKFGTGSSVIDAGGS
jgi:hypothetical protein